MANPQDEEKEHQKDHGDGKGDHGKPPEREHRPPGPHRPPEPPGKRQVG